MDQETKPSWLLANLPAIFYWEDDGSSGQKESYLGRFLVPFGDVLASFEELLAVIDSYFSPDTTPDTWVKWLAEWVALDLDENWDVNRSRQFLRKAIEIHRKRGTVAGLKQFLEIYNPKLAVTIREGRWRGGMQIGVASRIGPPLPSKDVSQSDVPKGDAAAETFGYYFFDSVADARHPFLKDLVATKVVEEGETVQVVFRTDRIRRVKLEGDAKPYTVTIHLKDQSTESPKFIATDVTRVDGLVDDLTGEASLIDEVEAPYSFIMDIEVPETDWGNVDRPEELRAIARIIEETKPVHTLYSLALTSKTAEPRFQTMQIGVHSLIDGKDQNIAIG